MSDMAKSRGRIGRKASHEVLISDRTIVRCKIALGLKVARLTAGRCWCARSVAPGCSSRIKPRRQKDDFPFPAGAGEVFGSIEFPYSKGTKYEKVNDRNHPTRVDAMWEYPSNSRCRKVLLAWRQRSIDPLSLRRRPEKWVIFELSTFVTVSTEPLRRR